MESGAFTLDAESIAMIGMGNVAVDVDRILASNLAEPHSTDLPQPVLVVLHAARSASSTLLASAGPPTPNSPPKNCVSWASCSKSRSQPSPCACSARATRST